MAPLRFAAKLDPFLSLDCTPQRPPTLRNPQKGRDQILPSGNLFPRRAPPPLKDVAVAPSGDVQEGIPTPMDTSERGEVEEEGTDDVNEHEQEQEHESMTEAAKPETEQGISIVLTGRPLESGNRQSFCGESPSWRAH